MEKIYYERSEDPVKDNVPQEGPEDTPFTKAIRNTLVNGERE